MLNEKVAHANKNFKIQMAVDNKIH